MGEPVAQGPQDPDFIRSRKKRSQAGRPMAKGTEKDLPVRSQIEEAIDHLLLEILTNQGPAESLTNRAPIHPLPEISEAVEEATEEADTGTVDTMKMTVPRKDLRTLIIHCRRPEKEPHLEDHDVLRLNSNYRSQKSSTESSLESKNGVGL